MGDNEVDNDSVEVKHDYKVSFKLTLLVINNILFLKRRVDGDGL
jgi:hypothetical protein